MMTKTEQDTERGPFFPNIMSETEVEVSVKNWTGPKEAEYAALLNDLAQLKLSNVNCSGFLRPP